VSVVRGDDHLTSLAAGPVSPESDAPTIQADTLASRDLPPDAPMAMPIQSLRDAPVSRETDAPPARNGRALLAVGATLALTGPATFALYEALGADSLGLLDILVLLVFAPLFAWTAFSFVSALAGLLAPLGQVDALRLDMLAPAPRLTSRTAILAPIYNEAPASVFARVHAMVASIRAAGGAANFDVFILSDTTDADIQLKERRHFLALRRRLGWRAKVFYRHRRLNVDRKAGNIASWVRQFGAAYDFMVTLDADSLMEGDTLIRLAGAMERHPRVGLIQTTPVVLNRHSLFARVEQFASRLYGPMLARGIGWWSGDQANYWGHNAIIRVRAFAERAGLPHLPGRKPFGGHILSHDFVEAALLRRAGWAVCMAPLLRGSYEESPPSLADLIARDRRWCQGNLQHLRVLSASGLTWISRLHLLRGISSYLTAPLWLALLVMSALLSMKPEWGRADGMMPDATSWGDTHPAMSVAGILALSIGFLLAPKFMAFGAMLSSAEERRLFGGAGKAFASLLTEIALSALVAPVLMLNQIWALISILSGGDSGWAAQHREEGDITFESAANDHLGDTAVGAGLAVATWGASTQTFMLMSPVIAGLVGCIPFAALTASCELGALARRAGLLVIPEEASPPPLLEHFNALRARLEREPEVRVVGPTAAERRSTEPALPSKAAA
jgi:membrane glycosyltransferase